MIAIDNYATITLTFLLAGCIKGMIGLGFPTIILAMLSLMLGVREAMALMLLPCFLTNVWQALTGGNMKNILKRIWPLLLLLSISAWITTSFIHDLDTGLLACLLAIIIFLYSILGLTSYGLETNERYEKYLTPFIGFINGIITGLTGTFVVPGVLYLQSLKMERDVLIQAMGILFLTSTAALGTGLFSHNLLSSDFMLLSALAVIPSFIGMAIGQKLRKMIPEQKFQKLFYWSLLLLGIYIFIRNIS